MTPELKSKWLAALRSGKYQQGHETLHPTFDRFCCLGVLCDVAGYEWRPVYDESGTEIQRYNCAAGEDYIEYVNELNDLGLPADIQKICYNMNDGTLHGEKEILERIGGEERVYSFAEIADWLEKNL